MQRSTTLRTLEQGQARWKKKASLRLKEIWAIRIRLQLAERVRELALFNLAVDSKLRSCDLVKLRVRDVTRGDRVAARAIVRQQKTGLSVQFEITEQTRESVAAWISLARRRPEDFLFPSRLGSAPHFSTRQYARIVRGWVSEIGLNPAAYGTHTMRRTKAALIYRRTKNLRVVQLLLGHSKPRSLTGQARTFVVHRNASRCDLAKGLHGGETPPCNSLAQRCRDSRVA